MLTDKQLQPKFTLGSIVATPSALQEIENSGQSPADFLSRHVKGDWGELCEEDRQLNDQALIDGGRVLSTYRTLKNVRIWVITEADRSATTLLLPEEY